MNETEYREFKEDKMEVLEAAEEDVREAQAVLARKLRISPDDDAFEEKDAIRSARTKLVGLREYLGNQLLTSR